MAFLYKIINHKRSDLINLNKIKLIKLVIYADSWIFYSY